jgi:hypothetical protein
MWKVMWIYLLFILFIIQKVVQNIMNQNEFYVFSFLFNKNKNYNDNYLYVQVLFNSNNKLNAYKFAYQQTLSSPKIIYIPKNKSLYWTTNIITLNYCRGVANTQMIFWHSSSSIRFLFIMEITIEWMKIFFT